MSSNAVEARKVGEIRIGRDGRKRVSEEQKGKAKKKQKKPTKNNTYHVLNISFKRSALTMFGGKERNSIFISFNY